MNQINHDKSPPQWALNFFRWFCDPNISEDIEGDLLERFEKRSLDGKKSRWLFVKDVLALFRPGIIRKIEGTQKLNYYGMFKHDFKTAFRLIRRERLYSSINILGLTSGLVIALLILFYVKFELSYEEYNRNSDRMVRITMDYLDGQTLIDQDCETYHSLGPMIQENFPEVDQFTRAFRFSEVSVKAGEKPFRAMQVYAVDDSFLDLFDYPILKGNKKNILNEPKQLVLTEGSAKKYFGHTDVIGESLWVSFTKSVLTVTGVVPDSPPNTHLKFDFLVSYSTMKEMLSKREDDWDNNDTYTYLALNSSDDFEQFQDNLNVLSEDLRAKDFLPNERIVSEKIKDIHLYSDKAYEPEQNGNATVVFFLLGVALLVVVIAIVNYINLSTAKSLDRAKEVGIRKVIGSSLSQLRIRFFIESLLINLLSGFLTIALVSVLSDPFKALADLPVEINIFNDPFFWQLFIGLLVISTLLSGSFPAFILSSFKPVTVLKGKFSSSKRGIYLRKVLVIFQFAIALFLLIQTYTASEQLKFLQKKDLGLNSEKVLVVHAPSTRDDMKNYTTFADQLKSRASVASASLSTSVPGLPTSLMGSTTSINLIDAEVEHTFNFFLYTFDEHFIPSLEIELLAGENFSDKTESENPIIINEETLRLWGFSNPEEVLGKKTRFWGDERKVIGVIKNFHQIGTKSAHIPMIFVYGPNFGNYVSLRLAEGDVLEQIEEIESVYQANFPNSPFEFFFLDQKFDHHYKSDQKFQQVFSILSSFSIIITCLGLFGLASFTVAKRTKEIGIRKVLGASASQIISMLSKDFMVLVLVSISIALPITYLIVDNWLHQYAYRIQLSTILFIGPALLVLTMAFLTVSIKTLRVSNANPVSSLRDE